MPSTQFIVKVRAFNGDRDQLKLSLFLRLVNKNLALTTT